MVGWDKATVFFSSEQFSLKNCLKQEDTISTLFFNLVEICGTECSKTEYFVRILGGGGFHLQGKLLSTWIGTKGYAFLFIGYLKKWDY